MSSSTPYAAQIRAIELLERSKAQTTELKFYRDGLQLVPTAATYTLIKPTGSDLLTGATAAISVAGTVSYAHTAEQLADTETLGEGYVQEWTVRKLVGMLGFLPHVELPVYTQPSTSRKDSV